MSVRAIVRPLTLAPNYAEGLASSANLLSPEPKSVALVGGAYVDTNFVSTAPQLVDTFFLGFIDGGGAKLDNLVVRLGVRDVTWPAAILPTKVIGGRRHALVQLAQPVSSDLFGFIIQAPSVLPITIGIFTAGLAFRPTWGGEWGGGVGLVDTASVTRRKDGGFGIDPGVRAMLPQWTFGDLSDTERTDLFGLLHGCGESEPMLVIEGDDTGPTLSEQIHWGLFTRIEAYERTAPGTTRWSLRFQDWV